MKFADYTTGKPFAKDPAVAFFAGAYWLYYSLPPHPAAGRDGWAIGIARSLDKEAWERVGELLPEQPCEQNGLCAPGVVVLGGQMHLFYQTYGNGPKDALCHAVSGDGLHHLLLPIPILLI